MNKSLKFQLKKCIFFFLLMLIALLSSCVDISQPYYTYSYYGVIRGQNFYEATISDCQYIVSGRKANWGTHKGNCNNPIHIYRSLPFDSLLIKGSEMILLPDSLTFAGK